MGVSALWGGKRSSLSKDRTNVVAVGIRSGNFDIAVKCGGVSETNAKERRK